MSVIALIPARKNSKGIPGKNLRQLGGKSLIEHAVECGQSAGCVTVLTTEYVSHPSVVGLNGWSGGHYLLARPASLAQDDTPMIAVVQHAMGAYPGSPEDIWLIVQPTQPFRTPNHVREAIRLLQETQADSVVSVVPLPLTHSPELVCARDHRGRLEPFMSFENLNGRYVLGWEWDTDHWKMPTRRQDAQPVYLRDGTVYAFWRKTVERHGTIYGKDCCALLIDPVDSCALDTEADWADCVRRWKERHG